MSEHELEQPAHLTPTQRLHAVTMAALTRAPAPAESSVELTRNAKGDRQWAITVRGDDPAECERLAVEIDARLAELYPHSSEQPPAGK